MDYGRLNQDRLMDLVSLLSLFLGYENLIENRAQSAHNDVQAANDQQAQYLIQALSEKFDEQNVMLKDILRELHTLNTTLKGRL